MLFCTGWLPKSPSWFPCVYLRAKRCLWYLWMALFEKTNPTIPYSCEKMTRLAQASISMHRMQVKYPNGFSVQQVLAAFAFKCVYIYIYSWTHNALKIENKQKAFIQPSAFSSLCPNAQAWYCNQNSSMNSYHITSHHIISCHVISCHILSYHVMFIQIQCPFSQRLTARRKLSVSDCSGESWWLGSPALGRSAA